MIGKRARRRRDSVAVEQQITLVITISYNGSPMVITYSSNVGKGQDGRRSGLRQPVRHQTTNYTKQ